MPVGIEHIIAQQRRESAEIALNTVTNRGAGYAAMRNIGISVDGQPDSTDDRNENAVQLSRFNGKFPFVLR